MNRTKTAATGTAVGLFGAAATGIALAGQATTDVTLDVDGHARTVSTTAGQVGQLLVGEHVSRGPGTRVSPAPSTPLHAHERIEVDHPWEITVEADGKTRRASTTADSVRGALAEIGIKIGPNDTVSVPLTAAHKDMTVVVKRGAANEARTPAAPATPAAPTAQTGQTGPASPTAPATSPSSGMDGAWARVAQCETGGNPSIVAGQFYGMYMMTLDAWHAAGGTGLPNQASATEQTARAQALYNRLGSKPWPVCGKYLP